MSKKQLSSYLNEHLTEETLVLDMTKRAAVQQKGVRFGTFFEMLSWELEEDRDRLLRLMRELGVRPHGVRVVLARIAAGFTGRSPVGTRDALESLELRISRELGMWTALRADFADRAPGVNFDKQIRSVQYEVEQVQRHRLALAAVTGV